VTDGKQNRRALILAGGGLKVAFQAGVLQVWLDEAGLTFDLADGASGGTFNLAMWCQGMSGRTIADNWRRMNPRAGVDFNWSQYLRLFYARSLFELDAYRKNVFPEWGLDWNKIRKTTREATFNLYNFSRHELEVVTPDRMTEDHLIAAVSLPFWFPPVVIDGDTYIDAVFNTDSNIEEAIRRGADELWIVWTVSQRGEWLDGFVATYFQVIETAANGRYKQILARIRASNADIERGKQGEFGRTIAIKELRAEVPLHYIINLSQDRLCEAVNRGVNAARAWCAENGIPLRVKGPDYLEEIHEAWTKLQFSETMRGFVHWKASDYEDGFRSGREAGMELSCRLTIKIDRVNKFVVNPEHDAAVEGTVYCEELGGELPIESGRFNLFVDEGDPARKTMQYRLQFRDGSRNPFTLSGHKDIHDDPGFDLWSDTTTLYTRILAGHIAPEAEKDAPLAAAGIIRISMMDFMKQLTTFRVEGPSLADRTAALGRFGRLFLGSLWDVYARELLSTSPV
jgi:predicted patatin/cPLA2 family phospholipase